jgi:hypothetical protein
MHARFNVKADVMVLTGPIDMGGAHYDSGDFMVSDGKRTWCVLHDEFVSGGYYQPVSSVGKDLVKEAQKLRGPVAKQQEVRV